MQYQNQAPDLELHQRFSPRLLFDFLALNAKNEFVISRKEKKSRRTHSHWGHTYSSSNNNDEGLTKANVERRGRSVNGVHSFVYSCYKCGFVVVEEEKEKKKKEEE